MEKFMSYLIVLIFFSSINTAIACTDFKIIAKDKSVLITRSMEFGINLNSNLRNANRGKSFSTTTPNNQPGLSWKGQYGYVYADGLNLDYAIDGINEAGLSFEYLYLPGMTTYQTIPAGGDKNAISYLHLGDWILGNFKSVDEVKAGLTDKYFFAETLPNMGNVVFPLHAAVFDASGKGIVIEFINGKRIVYDNVGIMTNSPTYDWHLTNLRNYLNLTPYNPAPVTAGGITYSATGQGAGMVGLPGDVSPPSRFVKIAFILKNIYPVNTINDSLILAQHIINNVDIPNGLARSIVNGKESSDQTEWVLFKDLTNKVIYYRSYNDMTLRGVWLNKIDFSENAPLFKMPIASAANIVDMTNHFLASKT